MFEFHLLTAYFASKHFIRKKEKFYANTVTVCVYPKTHLYFYKNFNTFGTKPQINTFKIFVKIGILGASLYNSFMTPKYLTTELKKNNKFLIYKDPVFTVLQMFEAFEDFKMTSIKLTPENFSPSILTSVSFDLLTFNIKIHTPTVYYYITKKKRNELIKWVYIFSILLSDFFTFVKVRKNPIIKTPLKLKEKINRKGFLRYIRGTGPNRHRPIQTGPNLLALSMPVDEEF